MVLVIFRKNGKFVQHCLYYLDKDDIINTPLIRHFQETIRKIQTTHIIVALIENKEKIDNFACFLVLSVE